MPSYLKFDGITNYAQITEVLYTATQWFLEISFKLDPLDAVNSPYFPMGSDSGRARAQFRTTSDTNTLLLYRWNAANSSATASGGVRDGNLHTIKYRFDGTDMFVSVDGGAETSTSAAGRTFDELIYLGRNQSTYSKIDINRIVYAEGANGAEIIVNDWNADLTNRTTGVPVLEDTVGGNDATGQNMPTDGSAWSDLSSTGVTATITEVLNSYEDSVTADIDINVNLTVTESLNPYADFVNVNIVESGPVTLEVTESLQTFVDNATTAISVPVIASVTESLNSFSDSAVAIIQKDIQAIVTEQLSSFVDDALIKLPTNWNVKQPVTTDWEVKTKVSTIWKDK